MWRGNDKNIVVDKVGEEQVRILQNFGMSTGLVF